MQRGGGARRQLELAERHARAVSSTARPPRDLRAMACHAASGARGSGGGAVALAAAARWRCASARATSTCAASDGSASVSTSVKMERSTPKLPATSPSSFFCASAWIAAASSAAAVFASLAAAFFEAALVAFAVAGAASGAAADGAAAGAPASFLSAAAGPIAPPLALARREERNGERSEDRPRERREGDALRSDWRHRRARWARSFHLWRAVTVNGAWQGACWRFGARRRTAGARGFRFSFTVTLE